MQHITEYRPDQHNRTEGLRYQFEEPYRKSIALPLSLDSIQYLNRHHIFITGREQSSDFNHEYWLSIRSKKTDCRSIWFLKLKKFDRYNYYIPCRSDPQIRFLDVLFVHEVLCLSLKHDPAVFNDIPPFAHVKGVADVLLEKEHRHALIAQTLQ